MGRQRGEWESRQEDGREEGGREAERAGLGIAFQHQLTNPTPPGRSRHRVLCLVATTAVC